MFHSNTSPLGQEKCQGMCIFDATHGSLRLTRRLAESFDEVIERAVSLARAQEDDEMADELEALCDAASTLQPIPAGPTGDAAAGLDGEYAILIAEGGTGMLTTDLATREVTVRGYRYTPLGLLYELEPEQPGVSWRVVARDVRPIYGRSPLVKVNLVTGEVEPVESH
jgi:hypothetical protein